MSRKLVLIIFLTLLVSFVHAQEQSRIVNRSTTVHVVEGKEYYFHVVLHGQTIFAIARAYGVTEDDIRKENPELYDHELRQGQMIRIPILRNVTPSVSPDRESVGDPRFIQHQVKRRETIFGISRQYNISQEELIRYNPEISSGLKVNSILRIPVKQDEPREYMLYQVLPRQTIFSISREFNVSIDELKRLNEGLKDGLKAGQVIKIPLRGTQPPTPFEPMPERDDIDATQVDRKVEDIYCQNPRLDAHYQVALMIPLYLHQTSDFDMRSYGIGHPSFTFMEYLQGVLIALDSIRAKGFDIRLYVYDVCDSLAKTRSVLRKPEIASMDLIIGPFHPNSLELVGEFSRLRNIPIVSPLYSRDNLLARRFTNMFQATPSRQEQMNEMARFIAHRHVEDNIIVIYDNHPASVQFVMEYKRVLTEEINSMRAIQESSSRQPHVNALAAQRDGINNLANNVLHGPNQQVRDTRPIETGQNRQRRNLKEVVFTQDGMPRIIDQMDSTRMNVLICLMGGQAVISNITRQLHHLRDTFPMTVFGVPQWIGYESLDPRYLHSLNVHLFAPDFIDYTLPHNTAFIRRFRSEFFAEPGVDAFRAVQTGMFFFDALTRFGREFHRCMYSLNNSNGALSPFWFQQVEGSMSGWENRFVYIFRYHNFTLEGVSDTKKRIAAKN